MGEPPPESAVGSPERVNVPDWVPPHHESLRRLPLAAIEQIGQNRHRLVGVAGPGDARKFGRWPGRARGLMLIAARAKCGLASVLSTTRCKPLVHLEF